MNLDTLADILFESLAEGEVSGDFGQQYDDWLKKWYQFCDAAGEGHPECEEILDLLDRDLPDSAHFALIDDPDLVRTFMNVTHRIDPTLGSVLAQFRRELEGWHDKLADETGIDDLGRGEHGRKQEPYVSDTPVSVAMADDMQEDQEGGPPSYEQERDAAFDTLADAQRGAPEVAMRRLQGAQISQLYGWVCEHTGDISHRMSQTYSFFKGGYQWVDEKVAKVLRSLRHPYGFRREAFEQIKSNHALHVREGNPKWASVEDAIQRLEALGKAYADEHRKLPVFNEVQMLARDAAIAMGEMDFEEAQRLLEELESYLARGREAWAVKAGEYDPGQLRPPVGDTRTS